MTDSLTASPITKADRNVALDVTRGFAVLGILAANIWDFAFPISMPFIALILDNAAGDWNGVLVWFGAVDGVMRTLFSLMFGAGMVLMLKNLEARDMGVEAANIFFRRIMWLFVFGLVNAFLFMWPGDILFMYALSGFIIFALRNASTRGLLLVVALLTVFRMGVAYNDNIAAVEGFNTTQAAIQKSESGAELTPDEKQLVQRAERRNDFEGYMKFRGGKEIEAVQSGFVGSFTERAKWSVIIESRMVYSQFYTDVLVMVLLGIVFYRWGLLTGSLSWARLSQITLAGLIIGGGIRYGMISDMLDGHMRLAFSYWQVFYDIGRLGMAVLYLGIVQMFVKAGILGFLKSAFAAAGQMALTNYLSQSIICAFIFYGFGFGLFGELRGWEPYYVVFGIWALQLLWSPIWLKFYRFGPFEWVWRSLTYGSKQPMKRGDA